MAYKSTFSGSVHSGAGSGYTNFAGSRGNKFRETTHDERDMGLGNK
jgi:hypothetical protein